MGAIAERLQPLLTMESQDLTQLDVFALQGQANKLAKLAKELRAATVEGRPKSYVARNLASLREIERTVGAILDGSIYGER